jgi:hypothetical protein
MGTRGFITFVHDGVEKTTYNHYDSYPEGLGIGVLYAVRELLGAELPLGEAAYAPALAELRAGVRDLRVVQDDTEVTVLDVDALACWTDVLVDRRNADDTPSWYQLLRGTQGSVEQILTAGYLLDASDYPRNSLFAEWGYVIDLDAEDLEVYMGFQDAPHDVGRFAGRETVGNGYYPVKRVAAWPLAELPTEAEFIAAATGQTLHEDES